VAQGTGRPRLGRPIKLPAWAMHGGRCVGREQMTPSLLERGMGSGASGCFHPMRGNWFVERVRQLSECVDDKLAFTLSLNN
jgi:hypothetical protein